MKIAIAADLHIGANKFGVSDEKWNEPVVELVDYAIENELDAVALAGDIQHKRNPSTKSAMFFDEQAQRLIRAGVHLIVSDGNHDDGVAVDSVSANWHLYGMPRWVKWARKTVDSIQINDVNIVLLPWTTPQAYLVPTDIPLKEQLELAQQIALEELAHARQEDKHNILIGHAMVAYGSGESDLAPSPGLQWAGKDVVFDFRTLAKGFDGVFLGHVHDPESMGYVGSSQPTDWGDAGQVKSFVVYDTDAKDAVRIPYKTSLKLLDHNHKTAAPLASINDHYDIGRWHYHVEGEEQEPTVEELAGIRGIMEHRCDVVESITVTKDRTVVQRVREDVEVATMSPSDAIDVWLRQGSVDTNTAKGVRSKFTSLLEAQSKE